MPKSKTSLNELLYDIRRIEQHREVLTESKIKSIYQSLMKDLNAFVANEYTKYADTDGRLYMSYLDAQNKRAKFLQEVINNVDSVSPAIREEMETLIDMTYQKSYEGMAKAVLKADTEGKLANITKDISVRPEVLKQAVANNISKLTLPTVLERHRAEVIYQIQQELNIGLMQGDRYEQMAKRISDRVGVSQSKAMNITRTETHRNIESGFMDCAENLQQSLDGSDLIYTAIWRTMKDERVRPQVRRKGKKGGWKTTLSRSGANHMKMEGVTVKAGDMFDLGDGVKAKAPSQSGVAAHDCNCRCFLEYKLMTIDEFAKATGKSVGEVLNKLNKSNKTIEKKPSKEKAPITASSTSTATSETYTVEVPKSLENFDSWQAKWVSEEMKIPQKTKDMLQSNIQTIIDNNSYNMRVHSKDLQSIIDNGFKNQMEVGKSGGTLSKSDRMLASQRLFGADVMHMENSEFEKYGYLGSYNFADDASTSDAWQYGKTIVQFNKERLKDRVTYTIDDSLGNALYNRVVGGKIGDECSISGIAKYDVGFAQDTFKYAKRDDLFNADKIAQDMGCRYWELQYHGNLTIKDVESVCFTSTDRPTKSIVSQLKELGIRVYKLTKGGKINEL